MKDHRKYIRWYVNTGPLPNVKLTTPSLYVYNKIDGISLDFLNEIAHEPYTAVMSCELDLGVQDVVDRIWKELRLIRVYTKRYDLVPSFCHPCNFRWMTYVE
jgi:ribosome-interacting GTPase 1